MKNNDEQSWREFEARDRKNNPAQWAIHDHMMNQAEQKGRDRGRFIMGLLITILIMLAIVFFV